MLLTGGSLQLPGLTHGLSCTNLDHMFWCGFTDVECTVITLQIIILLSVAPNHWETPFPVNKDLESTLHSSYFS